jgi:hypothetical protein
MKEDSTEVVYPTLSGPSDEDLVMTWKMLRIWDEAQNRGIQRHPRAKAVWTENASLEFALRPCLLAIEIFC